MPKPENKQSRVFIVDDDPSILLMLSMLLRDEGYLSKSAGNPLRAYADIIRHPPHLIISDIEMPFLTGFELLTRLDQVETVRNTPAILISAKKSMDGFNRINTKFISKPFDVDTILQTVGEMLKNGNDPRLQRRKISMKI